MSDNDEPLLVRISDWIGDLGVDGTPHMILPAAFLFACFACVVCVIIFPVMIYITLASIYRAIRHLPQK